MNQKFPKYHSQTEFIGPILFPVFGHDGTVILGMVMTQDITRQKESEEALRRSERELQRTLEATTDGIWTWNFKTNTFSFSPKYYTMLGYEPNEFPSNYDSWSNLIHPEDRKKVLAVATEYLETKPDQYMNEFRLKTKNGEYRWIRAFGRVVERDNDNDAVYMIGNHEDITERKEAEIALQLSEQKNRSILDAIPDMMFLLTR